MCTYVILVLLIGFVYIRTCVFDLLRLDTLLSNSHLPRYDTCMILSCALLLIGLMHEGQELAQSF